MKECDILGESKHTLTLIHIFRDVKTSSTPRIYALVIRLSLVSRIMRKKNEIMLTDFVGCVHSFYADICRKSFKYNEFCGKDGERAWKDELPAVCFF